MLGNFTKICVFAAMAFMALATHAFAFELDNEYLNGEKINAMCAWKGNIWVGTNSGLYRLEEEKAVNVSVPVKSNDRITSLYAGSPYALVCGTFDGDLLFVTQNKNDYCQAVWSMKDIIKNTSFYVNAVAQTKEGIWLGTLEKGVLFYNPETDSLSQFSLDYNTDTVGLNVYALETTGNGVVWTLGQDGLYFIMNIFGQKDELQYVRSNRIKAKPYDIQFAGNNTFLAYNQNGTNYLGLAKFGKHAFDLRIKKKKELPLSNIKAIQANSLSDCWILTEKISHLVNDRLVDYYINPTDNKPFVTQDMIKLGNYIYVSTEANGILKYAIESPDTKEEKEEDNHFDPSQVAFDKNLELDLVFFAPGDSSLNSTSYRQLLQLSELMLQDSTAKLRLTGHTARDGEADFLMKLSTGRANAVKAYLVAQGIAATRIQTVGKGATQLKVAQNPKSPKNRRVEIILSH